jgi:hypothetical protein
LREGRLECRLLLRRPRGRASHEVDAQRRRLLCRRFAGGGQEEQKRVQRQRRTEGKGNSFAV